MGVLTAWQAGWYNPRVPADSLLGFQLQGYLGDDLEGWRVGAHLCFGGLGRTGATAHGDTMIFMPYPTEKGGANA